MRYYDIRLTDQGGQNLVPSSLRALGSTAISSILPNGLSNPGALNVEFDIPVYGHGVVSTNSFVRIWGLSLQDIGNSFNLNNANIEIRAGFQKGLPLANPRQAGMIVRGTVNQAYGNWVGTDQSIDIQMRPFAGSAEKPLNWILDWQVGTTLESAIRNAITVAAPDRAQRIEISENLTVNHHEVGYYASLDEFASVILRLSKSIIKDPTYPGVIVTDDGVTITVSDLTKPSPVKPILFQDLVGQPTWIGPQTIQAKVALRADIDLTDVVTLPPGLARQSQSALTQFQSKDKTSFSGNYKVIGVHHFGNYRQADAASWNTTLDLIPNG